MGAVRMRFATACNILSYTGQTALSSSDAATLMSASFPGLSKRGNVRLERRVVKTKRPADKAEEL